MCRPLTKRSVALCSRSFRKKSGPEKKTRCCGFLRRASSPARKVALVGLGKSKTGVLEVRAGAARAARWANAEKAEKLAVVLPNEAAETVRAAAEGIHLGAYRFTQYFTGDRKPRKEALTDVLLGLRENASKGNAPREAALEAGNAVGEAVNLVRELVNAPPNGLPPQRSRRPRRTLRRSTSSRSRCSTRSKSPLRA